MRCPRRAYTHTGTTRGERDATPASHGPVDPKKSWQRGKRDRRYGLSRYRNFRLRVLRRDSYRCFVNGCARYANVLDHIEPVRPDTPDWLFFSESNARAACPRHNSARGWQTYASRELGESAVVTRDYTRPRVW